MTQITHLRSRQKKKKKSRIQKDQAKVVFFQSLSRKWETEIHIFMKAMRSLFMGMFS